MNGDLKLSDIYHLDNSVVVDISFHLVHDRGYKVLVRVCGRQANRGGVKIIREGGLNEVKVAFAKNQFTFRRSL